MMRKSAGAASRLLPVALVFGLIAACGQQPAPAKAAAPAKSAKNDLDEVHALIAATKNSPSLVKGSKYAGPPIHVDLAPKSSGSAKHDHMAM